MWTLKDGLHFDVFNLDTTVYKIKREYAVDSVKESVYIESSDFYVEYWFALINDKWYLINFYDLVGGRQ